MIAHSVPGTPRGVPVTPGRLIFFEIALKMPVRGMTSVMVYIDRQSQLVRKCVNKIFVRTTNENEMGRFAKLLLRLPGEILLLPHVARNRLKL